MYGHISPCTLRSFVKLKQRIFSHNDGMVDRYTFTIHSGGEISTAKTYQYRVLEPKNRCRKMKFQYRLINIISCQHICDSSGKPVHHSSRVDPKMLVTEAAPILDSILYACFNNFHIASPPGLCSFPS